MYIRRTVMDLTSTLAVLATVTGLLCQLIGIQICFKIVKKGGTGDISPVPFIVFFVSACVWLKYGLMTDNISVMLTSGQGTVLQFIYICIYYFYSTNKCVLHGMLLVGLITLAAPLVYVSYFEDDDDRAVHNIGLYCCVIGVLVYASPLATLSHVMKQKSTQSISLPLCLVNFMCAVEWSLYGLAINDKYVTFPNALGGVLGLIQFFIFYLYGCKEKSSKTIIIKSTLMPF